MLLRAPTGVPTPVVAVIAMVLLAVVDLGGAYATKEAVARRSLPWAIIGVALFVLLFYVYASSLQYAELTLVTLGWIVLLQVGVVLLDRFRYGQVLGPDKWLAIVLIIAAQTYLLLAPTSAAGAATGRPG
jgi:hypothetical protein